MVWEFYKLLETFFYGHILCIHSNQFDQIVFNRFVEIKPWNSKYFHQIATKFIKYTLFFIIKKTFSKKHNFNWIPWSARNLPYPSYLPLFAVQTFEFIFAVHGEFLKNSPNSLSWQHCGDELKLSLSTARSRTTWNFCTQLYVCEQLYHSSLYRWFSYRIRKVIENK